MSSHNDTYSTDNTSSDYFELQKDCKNKEKIFIEHKKTCKIAKENSSLMSKCCIQLFNDYTHAKNNMEVKM